MKVGGKRENRHVICLPNKVTLDQSGEDGVDIKAPQMGGGGSFSCSSERGGTVCKN